MPLRINKVFEKQLTLNIDTQGEDWATQNLDWESTILVESAELIASLGYKWWKNNPIDIANAKVEVADLLHFAVSISIQNGFHAEYYGSNWEQSLDLKTKDDPSPETAIGAAKLLVKSTLTLESAPTLIRDVLSISAELGMDSDELTKMYLGKNVLNMFRNAHGYKEGTYDKFWNNEENEFEDNVFMVESLGLVELGENFEEELYEHLELAYQG